MQDILKNEVIQWATRHKVHDLVQIFTDKYTDNPFESVQALNISYRELKEIPTFFSYFTELQILDMSHNYFTHIPEVVSSLPKLQYINISWNRVGEIPVFRDGVVVKSMYCRELRK